MNPLTRTSIFRRALQFALAGFTCLVLEAAAQGQAAPQADHLILPDPLPAQVTSAQIEVIGVFWYGCPHCYRLEPKLERWAHSLPPDVGFRRLPAVLTDSWRPAARLHYTLATLGRLDTLHLPVFEAEHVTRALQVQSRDSEAFAEWAARQGIPRTAWTDAWDSAAVAGLVSRAEELTRPLRRIGVPAIVVDGRYLTTSTLAGSPDRMLEVASRLIEQVRRERASR